jgi:hypothetical protein
MSANAGFDPPNSVGAPAAIKRHSETPRRSLVRLIGEV